MISTTYFQDDKCRYNAKQSGATDAGFVDIPEGNEDKLKAAIATVGPVSVAIDASHESFQFYSEGRLNFTQYMTVKIGLVFSPVNILSVISN